MKDRQKISSGAVWEERVGYSRAVRVGSMIFVSGTTASDPDGGTPIGGNDAGQQTREAIRRIGEALERLGATLEDVVRTRLYVTDIADWESVGQAHGEFFGQIRPASAMVEVSGLISGDLLVEVEADACLD